MKLYYWSPKLFNSNQKTNYITITIARKYHKINQNKEQFIQRNSLSIFLKINHIKIILEKFILGDNSVEQSKNLITFFIVKDEMGLSSFPDSDKNRKINIYVLFNEKYYERVISSKLLNGQVLDPQKSVDEKSYHINSLNNEFIQGIIVFEVFI